MSNAAAAHYYQEMGLPVLPTLRQFPSGCECGNRRCKGGRHLALPLTFATTDASRSSAWWEGDYQSRGIAHPTGRLISITVNGDADCFECGPLPQALASALELPTWTDEQPNTERFLASARGLITSPIETPVMTFFFDAGLDDLVVWPSHAKVHPHVTVRGSGSWAVLPPSHAGTAFAHSWRAGCSPEDVPLAKLPSELLPLLNTFSPLEDAETVAFANGADVLPCAYCGGLHDCPAESLLLDDGRVRSGFCLGCYEDYERQYRHFPWDRPAGEWHPGHLRAPSSDFWVARTLMDSRNDEMTG